MNYDETLGWMYAQLPMYQRIGSAAIKKDLTNTLAFCKHLGEPQRAFPSIHVAGTNGKGSVSHMLASVLQAAGWKVGLYTSPHLKDFRERIRINGKVVEEEFVIEFISSYQDFILDQKLSFFELTVGMAFTYFSQENVDIAVIEVGLGGRLDSTNVISPILSVITNIGMDHTAMLGDSLEKIAFEKAGIIKKDTPVVIGEYQMETYPVFRKIALERAAPFIESWKDARHSYKSDLKGPYQTRNIQTVVTALGALDKKWGISKEHIEKGIASVVSSTGLRGRWEILGNKPDIICDVAHNAEGLEITLEPLIRIQEKLLMVFGMVADKDHHTIMKLLPKKARYFFCCPNIPRGLSAEILSELGAANGLRGRSFPSVNEAYRAALEEANSEDTIFIGGSTFVVAEVL